MGSPSFLLLTLLWAASYRIVSLCAVVVFPHLGKRAGWLSGPLSGAEQPVWMWDLEAWMGPRDVCVGGVTPSPEWWALSQDAVCRRMARALLGFPPVSLENSCFFPLCESNPRHPGGSPFVLHAGRLGDRQLHDLSKFTRGQKRDKNVGHLIHSPAF